MSHDYKKLKILKKIISLFGFKLVEKDSIKNKRIIEKFSFKTEDFLNLKIKQNKIKKIIQVGANDGKGDDFLYKNLNKSIEAILIEPIESAFNKLKNNYLGYDNLRFLNIAVDITSQKKKIYSVNDDYHNYYKKKYNHQNVDWLSALSSFNKEHLLKHGIKKKHIFSHFIKTKTLSDIVKEFNFHDVDLIIFDTEGHDQELVKNLFETTNLRPIIIFEWLHVKNNKIENLLKIIKSFNYEILLIEKDLICFQN